MFDILVVQRKSHVSQTPFARSVAARVTEALDYLAGRGQVSWREKYEQEIDFEELKGVDAVFFNKHTSAVSVEIARAAKANGVCVVYDLDDWIVDFPDYSGANVGSEQRAHFMEHLKLADIFAVSNEILFETIQKYRTDILLVRNGFFVEKYLPGSPQENRPLRIVFSNADQLKIQTFKEDFIRMLNHFLQEHPEIELHFYGDPFAEMANIQRLQYHGSLSYDEHKRRLVAGKYAIAIVPLGGREDAQSLFFNSCKNPFKYFEYGGLGIPAIYSRSPIYEKVVIDGKTGILVNNQYAEWYKALSNLVQDDQIRDRIRKASREDVLANHSIKYPAEIYYRAIQRILS